MLHHFVTFFQPPKAKTIINNPDVIVKEYRHWRVRMLYTAAITYIFAYLCKKNMALALPGISQDLLLSFTEIGVIGSAFYVTYGAGKLINGLLADKAYIRTFITTGFFISACLNILIAFYGGSFGALFFLWGLNGFFQSMIFPPISKCLTHWFGRKEMATKWSFFAPSNEVGTALIFFIGGYILLYLNWKYLFLIPGLISLFIALFLYNRYRDIPKNMGLPPISVYKQEDYCFQEQEEAVAQISIKESFTQHILTNKVLWFLGLINVLIYIVRFGTLDWIFLFLTQNHYTPLESSQMNSFLPLAGIVGAFLGGILVDMFFNSRKMPLNSICFMASTVALILLFFTASPNYLVHSVIFCTIGFFIAMTKNLITGVCVVDAGPNNIIAGSTGFVSMFGYLGATLSGPIIGFLLDYTNWKGVFLFLIIVTFIATLMTFLMLQDENQRLTHASS